MPTARLWKQLGAPFPLVALPPSADSALGDWALKSVDVRQGRFIVGVNERTLMAVVFAERTPAMLPVTMSMCVGVQLANFGIPDERIIKEVAAIRSATFGKTRDRSHLGILNEVAVFFEAAAEQSVIASPDELLEIQTQLNLIPHRASTPACLVAQDAILLVLGLRTIH